MAARTSSRASWSERLRAQRRLPWWKAWLRLRWVQVLSAAVLGVVITLSFSWGVLALRGRRGREAASSAALDHSRRLVEVGDLRSAEETPVYVRTSGEVVWLIDEGALVKGGDVIARIDETEVRERLEEEERQLGPCRQELERAESELEAARARGPLRARFTEIKKDQARWELDDLVMRPTPDELTAAKLDLGIGSLRRDKTRKELARTEELAARGLATETELRSTRLKALNAEAEAGLAELRLEVLKSGASRLSLESARLRLEKARLEVEEARFLCAADVTTAEKQLEIAKARLSKRERQIERRKRDLENCVVRAPVAGRVAFVEVWKGAQKASRVEIGETCRWGQMVCKMADPDRMEVRVLVNEVDVLRLRLGQRARARLTAFPGSEIEGRVARIGVSAADKNERLGHLALRKAGQAGVNVVEVSIMLDRPPPGFRGGYTATVEIDLTTDGEDRPEAGTREGGADERG